MKFKYAGCSETGSVRDHNEDALLMRTCENAGLFLVADGIGGRADGEIVSAKLRDDYDRWWKRDFLPVRDSLSFHDALEQIKNTLLRINREVVERYGEKRAGSTLVLLFVLGGNCACLWTGDSRIYRFRGLTLGQMSRDDAYRAKGAADAKLNGKLISAVGLRTSLEYNTRTDTLKNDDGFFLCSDGVYRFAKLKRRLLMDTAFSAPESVVAGIRKEVLRNGAGDNFTMALVKIKL